MYTKYESVVNHDYSLVDNYTGEVKEYRQVRKVSKDEFIMLFLSSIPDIIQLNGNQIRMLMLIWKTSYFNKANEATGNIFLNDSDFKRCVRDSGLNLSDDSINVYVNQIAKKGYIIKRSKGKYMLNPDYFFKGRLNDAMKAQIIIRTFDE